MQWQLKKEKILPKRHRGQNFLIDKNILAKIVKAADISPNDLVLEVGAGTGVLTRELAKQAHHVVAVEIDKDLIQILRDNLRDYSNVTLIKNDILAVSNKELFSSYKLIGNIPYNITSRLLRKFLEEDPKPSSLLLLVQKEVAQRIVALEGKMALLSLAVQYFTTSAKILFPVSRHCFYPKPKVESAVILLNVRRRSLLPKEQEQLFFELIRHGFSSKRKKLISNLTKLKGIGKEKLAMFLKQSNLSENVRAEDLKLDDWLTLAKLLRGAKGTRTP